MLILSDVAKRFYDPGRGPVAAVDGIDLTLDAGVVALVGANGAGKSTLLRLIATLMKPDHGRITVAGIDAVAEPAAVRRTLGYLSTTTRLWPRLTVAEVLQLAGGFHGLTGDLLAERTAAVAETFGLAPILGQRVSGLCTGQAQRLGLARTLIADPDLIILDEPTTGLDVVAARAFIDSVRTIIRPGRLVLFATHIVAEVSALADRLVVLAHGQVVADGAPAAVAGDLDLAEAIHRLLSEPA